MYTELQWNALTQAIGFRRLENPPSSTSSEGLCPSPRRFLLLSHVANRWLIHLVFFVRVLRYWCCEFANALLGQGMVVASVNSSD
jgi:hypothetical protein